MKSLTHLVAALLVLGACAGAVSSDNSTTSADTCPAEGPWSAALEEWATAPSHNERHGRIMALPPTQGYYVTDRVGLAPPPPHYHPHPPPSYMGPPPPSPSVPPNGPASPAKGEPNASKQGSTYYDEWHASPPPPVGPGKIVNRPPLPNNDKFRPSPEYQSPPPHQEIPANRPPNYQDIPASRPPFYQDNQASGPPNYQNPSNRPPTYQENPANRPPTYHENPSNRPPTYHENPSNRPPTYQENPSNRPPTYQENPAHHPPTYHENPSNRPPTYQENPAHRPQQNPHRGPGLVDRVDERPPPPQKQVSETDLYLLSAIEKLVYRVDLMEKRLRKMEESVHYLVAGVDNKPDPCVENFTRIGDVCYHFSSVTADWKTANLQCRKLRSNLLELISEEEKRKFTASMLGDKRIKGTDIWTGGLNPGLLWIWAHSARPVLGNATQNVTIVGEGRCLALVYDPAVKSYVYRGQDCGLAHRYVCEKEEDASKLSNEIERVARQLQQKGAGAGASRVRKARIVSWSASGEEDIDST